MNAKANTPKVDQYADLSDFEAIRLISPYLDSHKPEDRNSKEISMGLYDINQLKIADNLLTKASSFDEVQQARELVRGVHRIY